MNGSLGRDRVSVSGLRRVVEVFTPEVYHAIAQGFEQKDIHNGSSQVSYGVLVPALDGCSEGHSWDIVIRGTSAEDFLTHYGYLYRRKGKES